MSVTPGTGSPSIAAGGFVVMTMVGNGSPDVLGTPTGTFEASGFMQPKMTIGPGPESGEFQLNWNRVAPIYEIERSTTLAEDDWETVKTVYGREDTIIVPDEPAVFYRLRAVQ